MCTSFVALAFNAQVHSFVYIICLDFLFYLFSLFNIFFLGKRPWIKKEVTEIIPFEVVTSWPDVIRRDPRELMYDNYDKALNCSFQRVSSDVKHPCLFLFSFR